MQSKTCSETAAYTLSDFLQGPIVFAHQVPWNPVLSVREKKEFILEIEDKLAALAEELEKVPCMRKNVPLSVLSSVFQSQSMQQLDQCMIERLRMDFKLLFSLKNRDYLHDLSFDIVKNTPSMNVTRRNDYLTYSRAIHEEIKGVIKRIMGTIVFIRAIVDKDDLQGKLLAPVDEKLTVLKEYIEKLDEHASAAAQLEINIPMRYPAPVYQEPSYEAAWQ
jgi:hypothetical protein